MPRLPCRLVLYVVLAFLTATMARAVTLKINVTPAGATVLAEGGQRLPAPATFDLKRRDNLYVFTIEKPGFQTETATWNSRDKVREITVSLAPLTAEKEVSIRTDPDGAAVQFFCRPDR